MKEFFVELLMWDVTDPGPDLVARLSSAAMGLGWEFRFRKAPITADDARRLLHERAQENAAATLPDGVTPFLISFSLTSPAHAEVQSSFSYHLSSDSPPKPYWSQLRVAGLLDFELKDQRRLIAPYADRMLELARALYPIARPRLAYIDNSNFNTTMPAQVRKLQLKALGWATFFSPSFVERYGEAFLLGLPGYKSERLPDGGVFYQAAPSMVAAHRAEARALREQVVAYCAEHGLKVACHAPYVVAGAAPADQAAANDSAAGDETASSDPAADVRALLETTFTLEGGLRLKTLYLPWSELSEAQRADVVATLRDVLADDVRRGGGPLRLELNVLPPEVERALVDLAGRDNPDFQWAVVEM